ncbi:carboxypeptidase O [Gracilinanus agilis]|uniref:carboxypeptidase O n=1 Tax=Gracilinanus agilis TaxID=191870 RepID=UPI001CFF1CEB|nr:carboxypeptidase O [Gracilinanus agilis]
MKKLLWTVCLLGILVPQNFGLKVQFDGILANDGHGGLEEKQDPRSYLENYDYKKYHPIEEIYKWMSEIRESYKEVVTQHFLGMTYEARPMNYLKISEPASTQKKIIWMDCGIHAREWIAPAFCQWFVREILQNYKTDLRISRFLRKMDFYILPVLNVDGYIYTWTHIQVGQKAAEALKAKHGSNYRVGSSSEILYPTSGSSRDWAYDIGIPFSYTFELRDNGTDGFLLPEDQIQPTCEETMAAVLSILDDIFEREWSTDRAVMFAPATMGLSVFLTFMLFF